MSVEKRISALLDSSKTLKKEVLNEAEKMGNDSVKKDTSIAATVAGDKTNPKQGSSKEAEVEVRHEDDENQGAKVSSSIKKNTLTNSGPGDAPNFKTVADPTKVVNMPNSKGNTAMEGTDLATLFAGAESLTEEFKVAATALFEQAVEQRAAEEVEKLSAQLNEEFQASLNSIVESFDQFADYLAAKWLEENALAVYNGTKMEIMESFVEGMKTVFAENYIEVPEEKLDAVEVVVTENNELKEAINEKETKLVEMHGELKALRKAVALNECKVGLSAIEAEKLESLAESVPFESEEAFKAAVEVLKENLVAKKGVTKNAETALLEDVQSGTQSFNSGSLVDRVAMTIGRAAKSRKV